MRRRFVVLPFWGVALQVVTAGLPGQVIPSGEVPAIERQPRTMINATVLAVLVNHDAGANGSDYSFRGPRRTPVRGTNLPETKPARREPSQDPDAEELQDVTCTLSFEREREPRRLSSGLLLEFMWAFDRTKTWRVRQLDLDRSEDDGKWSASEFQVGLRQVRKGRNVEFHALPRVTAAVTELLRIAAAREERHAVRISLDTLGSSPSFRITYRLGATNAENQRKALHAELASIANHKDSPLRLVELDRQSKPEKVGAAVMCSFAYRLRMRRD